MSLNAAQAVCNISMHGLEDYSGLALDELPLVAGCRDSPSGVLSGVYSSTKSPV